MREEELPHLSEGHSTFIGLFVYCQSFLQLINLICLLCCCMLLNVRLSATRELLTMFEIINVFLEFFFGFLGNVCKFSTNLDNIQKYSATDID